MAETSFDAVAGTLNSNITWKLLNSVTGTTQINLPITFNELLIEVDGLDNNSYFFTLYIIKSQLDSNLRRFRTGCEGCIVIYDVTSSTITLFYGGFDNNDRTSIIKTTVYYK